MAEDDAADGGSPPCFAHLLVDGHPVDVETVRDVARFRRAERSRLIAVRGLSAVARKEQTVALIEALHDVVVPRPGLKIAVYWPIRGEPDLRGWMSQAHAAGAQILLPVVVEERAPLVFRSWSPDCRMERGFWNILVPADGETVQPDTVIAPFVGVDENCFRLGNGGGYYDRTLAHIYPRPRLVGTGFSNCRMKTIFPMPWDIPMDVAMLSDGSRLQRQ